MGSIELQRVRVPALYDPLFEKPKALVPRRLRFDGFEPRPAGIRAMLPHVDCFLPAHNVASLKDLGRALEQLSAPGTQRLH